MIERQYPPRHLNVGLDLKLMFEEVIKISLQTEPKALSPDLNDDSPVTDGSIVCRVLEGDERAFGELFEKYKKPVARIIGRYFRERSEIEEFVQIAFTKTYFSLKDYRGGEDNSFPAWISRIAVNVCYDEYRRRQRKGESLFTEMSDDENEYLETVVDGRQPSVEAALTAHQLAEKVMSSLDARDKIAMTLVYSQDYSLNEAAEMIGISPSNLKSRLFRCRNQIKTRFGHLFG